ncbi:MAG: hypothetical protein AB199_04385 [Parcubacteria bacterium C7867-004]|nr:MAG: hypothetical protein AB199_04385 [Parcubacteria bacterium C7867-004]
MKQQRGFTLIELLVVIAIIGMLSSIVLASLNTARLKAADAAVRTQARQLKLFLEFEYSETGSYTNIKQYTSLGDLWLPGAPGSGSTCTGLVGIYAVRAQQTCAALLAASQSQGSSCGNQCLRFWDTNPDFPNRYSILAYLPGASRAAGAARWLCMGSGGSVSVSAGTPWSEAGCWANP